MGFFDPFGGSGSSGGGGAGMPGKDGRGISTIKFLSSSKGSAAGITGATDTYQITYTDGTKSTYVVKNGEAGERGERGLTGLQGPAGATPIFKVTDDEIQVSTDEGKTYSSLVPFSDITGPQGEKGEKGDKGDTGETGPQGEAGKNGNDGRGISSASISDKGILTLVYTDGTSFEVGNVKGADGTSINIIDDLASTDDLPTTGQSKGDGYLINGHFWVYTGSEETDAVNGFVDAGNIQGPAGRGVSALSISSDYNLIVTYSDNTQQTVGYVRGPQGEQGIQGEKGDKGDTGEKGDKGDTGEKGEDGSSITISSTSKTDGITKITFSDGTIVTINDGEKGETGEQGLQGEQGVQGVQGEKGDKGDTGVGISSVVKTTNYTGSAAPNIIRITMTDGSTYDFTVYNGHSGDNVELRNDGSSIQWRPVDVEGNATYMWTDIISLNDIRGPQGETGEQGIQGEKGEQGDPAKVRYINTILEASEWVDGTYTLTSEYFQGDNYINVGTHKDTTLAQYDALAAAKIICIEQSEGKIVLKSLGLIPSIDAPITIIIEGEQLNNVTDTYLMTDETTGVTYKMGINNGTTYFEEYTE